MAMLSVRDLQVYYGAIHAIKGISFEVNEGEIITLIGANGAGKTTTLHAISGLIKAQEGAIEFCGTDLRKTDAYKIPQLGLAQVPEGAPHLCQDDGAGKPGDGRVHPQGKEPERRLRAHF